MLLCLTGLKTPINTESSITKLPFFFSHLLQTTHCPVAYISFLWEAVFEKNGTLFYIQWQPTIAVLTIKNGSQIKVVQLPTWSAPIWNS
jgi:hypothetical protein